MKRLLIWLGWMKPPLSPERKAELVAGWMRVPEEALEDLPRFPTYVRFGEDFMKFLLEGDGVEPTLKGVGESGSFSDHISSLFPKKPDPDIETDKKY